MGAPRNPFCNLLQIFPFILTISNLTPPSQSATDYTAIVYKGCATQPLSSDPTNLYSQALSSLFGTLISQSSNSKFFKTTSGTSQTTLTGLFQCRGDLSNLDCHNCVSKLPTLMDRLCGRVVAARIQLLGCYMLYEGPGFPQVSGMEMMYKICSRDKANEAGFQEKRDSAFGALENGVGGGSGFFTTIYGGVFVLGQCEGDVGASDCVMCVKSAVGRAQVECGGSVGGQVYLHRCFIGYRYYPNGVPKSLSPGSYFSPSSGRGPDTGKAVAIIVGILAGVGFLVICLLFAKGLMKKKNDY